MPGWSVAAMLLGVGVVTAVHTVPELKLDKYLGRWYQMYHSPAVAVWFERGWVCVTADYGANPNGTVSVLNQQRLDTAAGALSTKAGYASATSDPGKFRVALQGVPFVAPYWVIRLDPESFGSGELYQYSVVTDSLNASLFVLARDVGVFRQQYQAEVLDFLREQGFTKLYNLALETPQTADCQYGPPPAGVY